MFADRRVFSLQKRATKAIVINDKHAYRASLLGKSQSQDTQERSVRKSRIVSQRALYIASVVLQMSAIQLIGDAAHSSQERTIQVFIARVKRICHVARRAPRVLPVVSFNTQSLRPFATG